MATTYHFDGQNRSDDEVLAAYRDVAPRIAADAARLSAAPSAARHHDWDARLDTISIEQYLDRLDMAPWLCRLLKVAYETEFGFDAGEQSCLNLLTMIGTDPTRGFEIFGASDERYKIREGVEGITRHLQRGLGSHVRLGHRLARLRKRAAGGYRLEFATDGATREVDADIVVLALPFTLLRCVEMPDVLPAAKQRCVDELGYGTNAKLIVALSGRPWRDRGQDGGLYTDLPMQTGWDGGRQSPGETGVYTWFMGGRPAVEMGVGLADTHARRFAAAMEGPVPGFGAAWGGASLRIHWPTEPFALGSYACYRPGQWTSIAGWEQRRVGQIYFAGEHCSREFQGYMNGAAETARRAAMTILEQLA